MEICSGSFWEKCSIKKWRKNLIKFYWNFAPSILQRSWISPKIKKWQKSLPKIFIWGLWRKVQCLKLLWEDPVISGENTTIICLKLQITRRKVILIKSLKTLSADRVWTQDVIIVEKCTCESNCKKASWEKQLSKKLVCPPQLHSLLSTQPLFIFKSNYNLWYLRLFIIACWIIVPQNSHI